MSRVRFKRGEQRKFIIEILKRINCPSLREIINRGIDINYSTLKNYYDEDRLISEVLFNQLIEMSDFHRRDFEFEVVGEHWGQIKGGKISRK